jgi:CubicO group peptidase (beta-lactamase class C family)
MSSPNPSKRKRSRRPLFILAAIILIPALGFGALLASTSFSQLSRALMWQDADVGDINRFPSREIAASSPSDLPVVQDERTLKAFSKLDLSFFNFPGLTLDTEDKLNSFLTDTQTTAFLVVKDGVVISEWYGEGVDHDTLQTSFSASKSFLSTLIGIAIDQGKISSLDDPITNYIPELLEKDSRFSAITLKHLITMTSGLQYVDEMSPFSDAADTYYSPDLRATALSAVIIEEPGKNFLYNNYNPLLLGMALERATGQKVTDYMSQVLWGPMGAEANGSWSLDSFFSGFEKMESGLNARAVDFARFGVMFAQNGMVDGKQVVPSDWVNEATAATNESVGNVDFMVQNYKYFWWVYPENQFAAQGNRGQFIFVSPDESTVIVRLGRDETLFWPMLMIDLSKQLKG